MEEWTFDSKDLVILSIIRKQPTRRHWKICISNKSSKSPRSFIPARRNTPTPKMFKHQEERRKKRNFIIHKTPPITSTKTIEQKRLGSVNHRIIYHNYQNNTFHWRQRKINHHLTRRKKIRNTQWTISKQAIESNQDFREIFSKQGTCTFTNKKHKNRNIRNTTRKEP